MKNLPDLSDEAILRWGLLNQLRWFSNRAAHAVLWGQAEEGIALSSLEDQAWFVNRRGKFKFPFEAMRELAEHAFDIACERIHVKHGPTLDAMTSAASEAYQEGDVAGAALAAAAIARAASRKPPPSYVAAAVDETLVRRRIERARQRRVRS